MDTKDTITTYLSHVIDVLPSETNKTINNITDEAERIVRDNTPKSGISFEQRQKVSPARKPYYTRALSKSVGSTGIKGTTYGAKYRAVYYDKVSAGWRAHFTDSGVSSGKTGAQKGQGFIKESRKEVNDLANKEFSELINDVFDL